METLEQCDSTATCLETPDLHPHYLIHYTLFLTTQHAPNVQSENTAGRKLRQRRGFLTLPTPTWTRFSPWSASTSTLLQQCTLPPPPQLTHYTITPQLPMMRDINLNSGTEQSEIFTSPFKFGATYKISRDRHRPEWIQLQPKDY